jgi:hypothetical protein
VLKDLVLTRSAFDPIIGVGGGNLDQHRPHPRRTACWIHKDYPQRAMDALV